MTYRLTACVLGGLTGLLTAVPTPASAGNCHVGVGRGVVYQQQFVAPYQAQAVVQQYGYGQVVPYAVPTVVLPDTFYRVDSALAYARIAEAAAEAAANRVNAQQNQQLLALFQDFLRQQQAVQQGQKIPPAQQPPDVPAVPQKGELPAVPQKIGFKSGDKVRMIKGTYVYTVVGVAGDQVVVQGGDGEKSTFQESLLVRAGDSDPAPPGKAPSNQTPAMAVNEFFTHSCVSCHKPNTKRLDLTGDAAKLTKAQLLDVYYRITAPDDDKDVMPPAKKGQARPTKIEDVNAVHALIKSAK